MINAFRQSASAGKDFANTINQVGREAAQSSKQIQDAYNKQAAAARVAATEAKAAAERATAARNTAAAQAAVAADKEIAAIRKAQQAAQQASEAKVRADAIGTQSMQQAAAAQQAAADRAANAAVLAAQQKINANLKATAAADDEAKKIAAALRAEEGAVQAAARAQEYAEASVREARARSMQDLNANVQQHKAAYQNIGNLAIGAGVVVAAGIAMMVKAYMDFDKSMSAVQAATRATGGDLEALRNLAIKAGADTSFSAAQAADGITELAKAGVHVQDILNGGLAGALSLAAAGQMGVAESAELAATAMVTFGLKGDKIPHIADLLAAAAGKAQGSVHDMGEALKMSALVADSLGISIEDTTGTLAAFANAGLIGSDAGTSFKTMLMRLTPQSQEARDKMKELGFSAYDAGGQFIGMTALAQEMKDSFGNLDQESRNAALGIIFGADAVRAANILFKEGADGIKEWIDNVNAAGYAAAQASIMQDNLSGDIEKLGGSIDSVFIQSGSGANTVLRDLVQSFTELVNWIGTLDPEVLDVGVKFAAAGAAGLILFGAVTKMLPGIIQAVTTFRTMNEASSPIPGKLGAIAKAAAVAGAALAALTIIGPMVSEQSVKGADDYASAILRVTKAGQDAKASDLDSVFQGWGKIFGNETNQNVQSMAKAVDELAHQDFGDWMNVNFADKLNATFGFTKTEIGQTTDRLRDYGKELANVTKNGGADAAAKSFQLLTQEFVNQGKTTRDALNYMPEYEAALKAQADALGMTLTPQELANMALGEVPQRMRDAQASTEAAASGLGTFTGAAGELVKVTPEMNQQFVDMGITIDGVVQNLAKYIDALFQAGILQMDSRTALANYNQTFIDAQKATQGLIDSQAKLGPIFNDNASDFNFTTESGIKANSMFQGLAKSGIDTAEAMAKNSATMPEVQKQMRDTYDAMVITAEGFGMSHDQAVNLTDSVLKIPPGVSIESWMSDQAKLMADKTKGAVDAIPPRKDVVVTYTLQTVDLRSSMTDLNGADVSGTGRMGTYWMGGPIRKFADGGFNGPVVGPGTSTSDSILTALSAGEYVIQAKSVAKYGNAMMAAINGGAWEGAANPMKPTAATSGVEHSVKDVIHLFDQFSGDSDKIFKDFHATTKDDFDQWGEELASTTTDTWTDMGNTATDGAARINQDAHEPLRQGSVETGDQFTRTGQTIGQAWANVQNTSSAASNWVQTNAYGPLQAGAAATGAGFGQAAGQVEAAFARMQNAGKEPVRFLIDVVYNQGIKGMWDPAAKFLGLDPLPVATVPAFHDGGIMSGYTPGIDDRTIAVGGGEAIMRPEWTKAVGPAAINKMNRLARANDRAGIKAAMGATAGPAFADGGVFDPAPAQASLAQMPYASGILAAGLTNMAGRLIDGLTAKATAALAAMQAAAGGMNPAGPWTGGPSGLGNPLPGSVITQWFSAAHNGIDMAAPQGTRIGSAGPGVVSYSGWSAYGGGNEVHVDHPNGLQTWYAHMASPGIGAGSTVQGGSYLGPVGMTGNATGPHLHFMVLNGGWPNVMNPAPFIGLANGGIVPTFDQGGSFSPGLNLINNATGATENVVPVNKEFAEQLAEAVSRALGGATLKIEGIDHITGAVTAKILTNTRRKAGIR